MTDRDDLDLSTEDLDDTDAIEPADREFAAFLLRSARGDRPERELESRLVEGVAARVALAAQNRVKVQRRRWTFLLAAAAFLGVVGVGVKQLGHSAGSGEIAPEPTGGPLPAAATSLPVCAHPVRAAGFAPNIDDFEDDDNAVRPLEGRGGKWVVAGDTDPKGTVHPLFPSLRPQPMANSRFALHLTGGEYRDWGVSIQVPFQPSCYDASVYAGIRFSARGPGRVYVSATEIRVVETQYGGTCKQDCYNAHARKVDLGPDWAQFTVRWEEMKQRGYQSTPLNPAQLHNLSFLVHAEDTPYDFWIDDVEFLPR